jgi:hypothetical protein
MPEVAFEVPEDEDPEDEPDVVPEPPFVTSSVEGAAP